MASVEPVQSAGEAVVEDEEAKLRCCCWCCCPSSSVSSGDDDDRRARARALRDFMVDRRGAPAKAWVDESDFYTAHPEVPHGMNWSWPADDSEDASQRKRGWRRVAVLLCCLLLALFVLIGLLSFFVHTRRRRRKRRRVYYAATPRPTAFGCRAVDRVVATSCGSEGCGTASAFSLLNDDDDDEWDAASCYIEEAWLTVFISGDFDGDFEANGFDVLEQERVLIDLDGARYALPNGRVCTSRTECAGADGAPNYAASRTPGYETCDAYVDVDVAAEMTADGALDVTVTTVRNDDCRSYFRTQLEATYCCTPPTPAPTTAEPTSDAPTVLPTSSAPSSTPGPTPGPTPSPTSTPAPSVSSLPTTVPTAVPTATPAPSSPPSSMPTAIPTAVPTSTPTALPTSVPSTIPAV